MLYCYGARLYLIMVSVPKPLPCCWDSMMLKQGNGWGEPCNVGCLQIETCHVGDFEIRSFMVDLLPNSQVDLRL